jgi:hypothetical protein
MLAFRLLQRSLGHDVMAFFAVSYELKHQSELARRRFCDEVERLGGVEVVDRVYILELDGEAEEVRNHLAKYLTDIDRLIAVEFDKVPATRMLLGGAENWIVNRFATAVPAE